MSTNNILDVYLHTAPTAQAAVDIFKGEWSSKFPPPLQDLVAGPIPLFQDDRLEWALEQLGGVQGQSVLELGPLEGGHSYMLDKAGAASVISIEANSRAFLKCLVSKELLNIQNIQFQCGDFMPYLENCTQQFDFILATGVLYHMKDPLRLLKLISTHTARTFIWTHYYEENIIKASPPLRVKFPSDKPATIDGLPVTLHRQEYLNNLTAKTYCGGNEEFSHWLSRKDLLDTVAHLGFTNIQVKYDLPNHPHGPSLGLVASKS